MLTPLPLVSCHSSTVNCVQLMEEAGQGVVALHQRGIVHRDIKPQNILLTDSRRAKVSDMGLCKRLAIDQSSFESRGPGSHPELLRPLAHEPLNGLWAYQPPRLCTHPHGVAVGG